MNDLTVKRGDGIRKDHKRIDFTVILDNLRSARNVGAIFRTCDAVGAGELVLCGTTAVPPHDGISMTAMGSENFVKWSYSCYTVEAVRKMKRDQRHIITLETTTSSKCLWDADYPDGSVLVIGNEALGISEEIIKMSDEIIDIPMMGYKNSLNVASAFSVIAYEILRRRRAQL